MWKAFLPGAAGEGEDDEEDPSQDENGSGRAHTGHRPGQMVEHGHGALAGQQGQDGLVEDQDGQEDQDTCPQDPERVTGWQGGCSAACVVAPT